jgi:hypothetical protein
MSLPEAAIQIRDEVGYSLFNRLGMNQVAFQCVDHVPGPLRRLGYPSVVQLDEGDNPACVSCGAFSETGWSTRATLT